MPVITILIPVLGCLMMFLLCQTDGMYWNSLQYYIEMHQFLLADQIITNQTRSIARNSFEHFFNSYNFKVETNFEMIAPISFVTLTTILQLSVGEFLVTNCSNEGSVQFSDGGRAINIFGCSFVRIVDESVNEIYVSSADAPSDFMSFTVLYSEPIETLEIECDFSDICEISVIDDLSISLSSHGLGSGETFCWGYCQEIVVEKDHEIGIGNVCIVFFILFMFMHVCNATIIKLQYNVHCFK